MSFSTRYLGMDPVIHWDHVVSKWSTEPDSHPDLTGCHCRIAAPAGPPVKGHPGFDCPEMKIPVMKKRRLIKSLILDS
jgi:hypothetical protein